MALPTSIVPRIIVGGLCLLAVGCTRPDGAKVALSGKALYSACVACHGETGAGNATLAAPPIAGLPAWYVEAQLSKFRSGLRGYHTQDFEGLRMRPMSRQLMDSGEVKTVSVYVASLPLAPHPTTLSGGDAVAGKSAFATCAACHGANGQGNDALKAPPLAGQADWYLLSQLKKFKGGLRGAKPDDAQGAQMRPMAMALADEQAMKNVLAHVATLTR